MRIYFVFEEDGSFTEQIGLPDITSLTQYAYAPNADIWWNVQIKTGFNDPMWLECPPEDVPSGIRLLCMLVK